MPEQPNTQSSKKSDAYGNYDLNGQPCGSIAQHLPVLVEDDRVGGNEKCLVGAHGTPRCHACLLRGSGKAPDQLQARLLALIGPALASVRSPSRAARAGETICDSTRFSSIVFVLDEHIGLLVRCCAPLVREGRFAGGE
jgi:hypothetical protein